MKKYIPAILLLIALAGLTAVGGFANLGTAQYDGKINIRKSHDVIDANFALVVAQNDTNTVTVTTSYTPDYRGQILIGLAGTGTNAVWISKGTTTNDWVQVAP